MDKFLAILNPQAWLSLNPLPMEQWAGRIFLVTFCLFFVAGIFLRYLALRKKKHDRYAAEIYRRFASLGFTAGAIGLVLAFFSFEGIRFLGARFWYPLWAVLVLLWGFYAVRYMVKQVPRLRLRDREREEKLKYMPGASK